MKCIVVFYSLSGRTKKAAERLAGALGCEAEEIRESGNRKGFPGFFKSGFEALRKKLPPIAEPQRDPAGYDLVVLGAPVWAGTMASPMRTYLTTHGRKVKKAALFCTAGGSAGRTFREMESLLGRTGIAELALLKSGAGSRDLFETGWANRIDGFAATLKSQMGEKPVVRAKGAKAGSGAAARRPGPKTGAARSGPKKSAASAGKAGGGKSTGSKARGRKSPAKKSPKKRPARRAG